MRARYLRGVLSSCASHVGISLFLGGLFANWWFYFTTRTNIWSFLVILTIATIIFLRYLIRRKDRTSATT
jgi:phosphoglycerol transferase MdoB-like AlkP superfamily enzyme